MVQCGFRPGKSTIDQIFTLRQILEKMRDKQIKTFHLFVDFKSAFDTPHRDHIYATMSEFGIFCLYLPRSIWKNRFWPYKSFFDSISWIINISGKMTIFWNHLEKIDFCYQYFGEKDDIWDHQYMVRQNLNKFPYHEIAFDKNWYEGMFNWSWTTNTENIIFGIDRFFSKMWTYVNSDQIKSKIISITLSYSEIFLAEVRIRKCSWKEILKVWALI